MAKLAEGVSSPEVMNLQKCINKILGKGTVKETGSYDEETTQAVAEMQKKIGVTQTGTVDVDFVEVVEDVAVRVAVRRHRIDAAIGEQHPPAVGRYFRMQVAAHRQTLGKLPASKRLARLLQHEQPAAGPGVAAEVLC